MNKMEILRCFTHSDTLYMTDVVTEPHTSAITHLSMAKLYK